LVSFRAIIGLGESIYYPAAMSLLAIIHGKETRSRVYGHSSTGVYIGTIAGRFFAGLIGQYYGWRLVVRGLRRTRHCARNVHDEGPYRTERGAADLADLGAKPDAHLAKEYAGQGVHEGHLGVLRTGAAADERLQCAQTSWLGGAERIAKFFMTSVH
jgi:hypothetical protein